MTAITVEEMIEALERCDPHKPVSVCGADGLQRVAVEVKATSPQSVSNPVVIIGDPN